MMNKGNNNEKDDDNKDDGRIINQGIKRKKISLHSAAANDKNTSYTIVTRFNMRKKIKSEAEPFTKSCPPPPPSTILPPEMRIPKEGLLDQEDSFEHLSNWSSNPTSTSSSSCIYVSSHPSSSSSSFTSSNKDVANKKSSINSSENSTLTTFSQEEESVDNFDNYHVNAELGKGTFAKVFLGIRKKDKQPVVLKMTKDCEPLPSPVSTEKDVAAAATAMDSGKGPKKTDCWQLRHEHEILKSIPSHPHIVSCLGFFDEGVAACLVLEHAAHGDLFSHMKKGKFNFCEENARKVLKQLVHAVDHLHHHGIVHRDLKVENILLFDPQTNLVKICDFGLASNHHHRRQHSLSFLNLREYCQDEPLSNYRLGKAKRTTSSDSNKSSSDSSNANNNNNKNNNTVNNNTSVYTSILKTPCGSVCYAAPELFVSPVEYNASVDVWSLGVILYIMLHGEFPFLGETTALTIKKICLGKYITFCQMSKDCEDLLKKTILVDPSKRLTIKEMKVHPFLK